MAPAPSSSIVPAGIRQLPGRASDFLACLRVIGTGGKYLRSNHRRTTHTDHTFNIEINKTCAVMPAAIYDSSHI